MMVACGDEVVVAAAHNSTAVDDATDAGISCIYCISCILGISCFWGSGVHQKYAEWVLIGCEI